MAIVWHALAVIQAVAALAQIVAGGDGSQAILLCVLLLILATIEGKEG